MFSINTLILLSSCITAQYRSVVQASNFNGEPSVPREGNGVTTLDSTSMVRSGPIPPVTYVVTNDQGQLVTMNGTQVVSTEDMLDSAFTASENQDLSYLEWAFNTKFSVNADEINKSWKTGTASKMPWPGSYWPAYQDGINARWDRNGPSASEKYAKANGMSVTSFLDKVSKSSGVDSWSWARACKSSSQCGGNGNVCGIRYGKGSGYCIPAWVGICHAWSPAAMLEDEPKCPVKVNGVTFKVKDIKALISEVYDGAGIGVIYAGVRFDGGDGDKKDQYGRYIDLTHRDIGPAMFHIALANIIGRLGKNFLLDVEAGPEVWNQPIRGYQFSDPQVMKPDDAAKKFFGTSSYAGINSNAVKVHYVRNTFKYIVEGYEDGQLSIPSRVDQYTEVLNLEYLLELDASNNIIGGEWVGNSRYEHPDFIWVPLRKPDPSLVTSVGLSYSFVSTLIQKSREGTC